MIGWGGELWKTPWRGSLKKTEVEGKGYRQSLRVITLAKSSLPWVLPLGFGGPDSRTQRRKA